MKWFCTIDLHQFKYTPFILLTLYLHFTASTILFFLAPSSCEITIIRRSKSHLHLDHPMAWYLPNFMHFETSFIHASSTCEIIVDRRLGLEFNMSRQKINLLHNFTNLQRKLLLASSHWEIYLDRGSKIFSNLHCSTLSSLPYFTYLEISFVLACSGNEINTRHRSISPPDHHHWNMQALINFIYFKA